MDFDLDVRLSAASAYLLDLDLCQARLQLDARFPWIVLVPRRSGARELEDLSRTDLTVLTREIIIAGEAVRAVGLTTGRPVEKLNVGALGNVVPQLHIHIVGRHVGDKAWPGPVWGVGEATAYEDMELEGVMAAAKSAFARAPSA